MYSVDDLLISHGYKLPRKHSPPPHAAPRSRGEGGPPYAYPSRSSSALGSLTSASGSTSSSSQRDLVHSHGRAVLADPGFYDTAQHQQHPHQHPHQQPQQRGLYVQPHSGDRGMAYWKRRGQDFSALLDYADGGRVPMVPVMQPRPDSRAMSARERELALQQWRLAAERRQHGTDGGGGGGGGGGGVGTERWAQPQQPPSQHQHHHPHHQQQLNVRTQEQPRRPRTAEGAVPPRNKAKSQSLPRMALSAGPLPGRVCLSAGPSSLQLHEGGVWMSTAAAQARGVRQSRPPRPPSYEVHQQTRANAEGSMSRAPSRQSDYCHSEPPGYMPPPSYRRQPIMGGAHGYRELLASYMYRHDPYQQALPLSEGVQWYARQAGGTTWPDHHHHSDGRRSAPCRPVFPVYSDDGRGVVQYIPFDDPRVRHISGGLLTDADKIRNIQNSEIPGITVQSEQSPDDSAFLSPQESLDSSVDVGPMALPPSSSTPVGQWPSYPDNLSSAPDLNRNPGDLNRNPANDVITTMATTPDPANGKRQPFSSRQSSSSDQGFSETITQVKKFEPEPDSKKPARRRQKETMFCLVSVPIAPQQHTQQTLPSPRDNNADQNNNNKAPSPTVMSMVTLPSNQSSIVCSQPVSIPEPQQPPGSPLGSRMSRRAPLRRELVDAWTLQARCSGSWPGDQYRNQQTQTGSPEITRAAPPPSLPVSSSSQQQPAAAQPEAPSSDSTTDSGLGNDCCGSYGLPMKGQRSISPSSTSAFSRTSQPGGQPSQPVPSPAQLRSPPKTPPAPSPRRSNIAAATPQPTTPTSPRTDEPQEVFGQFLLKPVGRRPWDAIGQLESFNNESQIIQEPSAAAAQRKNPEPSPTRSTEPLATADEYRDDADKMDISPIVDEWGLSELVPLYRRTTRVSPCWSEDQTAGNRLQSEELNGRQETSRHLRVEQQQHHHHHRAAPDRQGIPVPQESLMRNVGLTVYTPDPHRGAPEQQCYSSLPPLTDTRPARDPPSSVIFNSHSHSQSHYHTMHQASGVPNTDSSRDVDTTNTTTNNNTTTIPNPPYPVPDRSVPPPVAIRRHRFRFSSTDGPAAFLTASLPTFSPEELDDEEDEVLGALLSRVKRQRPPSEDLTPLYQVQSASGIPQNESIEERAARILGISVPAASLVKKRGVEGGGGQKVFGEPAPSLPANQEAGESTAAAEVQLKSTCVSGGEPGMPQPSETEPELVSADIADGAGKVDELGERRTNEEEAEVTQTKVKEEEEEENTKEEEIGSLKETEIPGETTEEGEAATHVSEGESETSLHTQHKSELSDEGGESLVAAVTATQTEQEDDTLATRQTETAVSAQTPVSVGEEEEEESAQVSVSPDADGDGAGEEENLALDGCDITEKEAAPPTAAATEPSEPGTSERVERSRNVEISGKAVISGSVEISGTVEVSGSPDDEGEEAVEMAEEVQPEEKEEEEEEVRDELQHEQELQEEVVEEEEVRQVSTELGELQLAVSRGGAGEEEEEERYRHQRRRGGEEGEEVLSDSPDSYIAIATLEMPEILSIMEEEEDDEEDTGLGLYSRRRTCLEEEEEQRGGGGGGGGNVEEVERSSSTSAYTQSYLTLGHAGREEEEEEEEVVEEEKVQTTESVEEVLMETAQRGGEEEEVTVKDKDEEAIEEAKAITEERQIKEEETRDDESLLNQETKEEEETERESCTGQQEGGGEEEEECEDGGVVRSKPRWAAEERPCPGVQRPTPLPRNTVVKREIRLPLAALEDADTYTTSDSYDPSRVERV
ncbi:titin isoform X2 [Engraulis encrasicolus]|uniref:titin isoform X2 n=1 Tax=Engraulis encrasicolus TaxID=184585 RepID=UPI002FD59255